MNSVEQDCSAVLSSFEQSQKGIIVQSFYDQFFKQLPRLAKITKGYYREEPINTFEIGQVT